MENQIKKPRLLVLHPKDWATSEHGKKSPFEIRHVSIGGEVPRKLNGTVTYDGYAEAISEDGVQNLYEVVENFKPHFFLFWLHAGFYPTHLERIKELSPHTRFLFWFGNHRTNLSGHVTRTGRYLSALFLNSKEPSQFNLYSQYGIAKIGTLYDGFNPDSVKLIEEPTECDCFFAGESYEAAEKDNQVFHFPGTRLRRDFILAVHRRFNLRVHAARKDSWPFLTYPEVYHPAHTHAMRKAKITLNVNHFPTFKQAYTRRTIRSLFARRCHITYYIPGMEEDFENHKHLVWFHSVEDGLAQIAYYLKNSVEAEKIAQAGWELACERYTFNNRLDDFGKDLRKFFPEVFKK